MRFQDWDVLIFPNERQVPQKEFRTNCHAEPQDDNPAHPSPLLHTFIPSLAHGTPFNISIHSWSGTGPVLPVPVNGERPRELFQIKVVIDGQCVAIENVPINSDWPRIIASTTPSVPGEHSHELRFPPFHRSTMSHYHFDASDGYGRIRVELSAGYVDMNQFIKLFNVVNFTFQHVPTDILEKAGISWPSARISAPAPPIPAGYGNLAGLANGLVPAKHKKGASISALNQHFSCNFPVQPPPTPFTPHARDTDSNYDMHSRSTSAYSTITQSGAPLMHNIAQIDHARMDAPRLRLPSDQLRQIISAMQGQYGNLQQQNSGVANAMPPPPIPTQHATPKASQLQTQRTQASDTATRTNDAPEAINPTDRRADSRYSDVSMHAGCDGFPSCLSEDAEGHTVHAAKTNADHATDDNFPGNEDTEKAAPDTVVRGRKEGSLPTKPRNFFSTILDATAATAATATMETSSLTATAEVTKNVQSSSLVDGQGRKRTRSALRSLNINNKSPGKKVQPARKVSKTSHSSSKAGVGEGQENGEKIEVDA